MCGIAGIAHTSGTRPVWRERLPAMCRALSHRGPDDERWYLAENAGLAVRRLAIIDLAGGTQPVCNEDRTVHAVINGEIYNFRALRRQLEECGHRFKCDCDSEVVPHLYEELGTDFAAHLEGMYAIAVWDERCRRLTLCRDRLGIKPLYYSILSRGMLFGSEIKAVQAGQHQTALDPQALSDYLSLMYVPGSRTAYAGIQALPPATTLVWREGSYTIKQYWDVADVPQQHDLSATGAREELRNLLLHSVDEQLAADVPVGLFLSGGVDSSSIVAAARQARPDAPLRTFSVGFPDRSYDERRAAAQVSRRLNTDHTELTVEPRPEDVVDRILPSFDQPFADPSMVPTYYLCQLARQHVGVALSGDGGDELFAGYRTYQADKLARYYRRLPRIVTERLAPTLVRRLPASSARTSIDFRARRFVDNALEGPGRRHYLWRVVFRELHKQRLLHPDVCADLDDTYRTHERYHHRGNGFDPLTRCQYTDTNVYLPDDVLVKVDRLSMANALEVRVPMLATRVAEFAFSLPAHLKMPGYQPKRLLRRTMADLLPAQIVGMPKKGFNAPLPRWLRETLRPLVGEYLNRQVVQRQGYFRFEEVDRLVRCHMTSAAEHSREIWTLLMFSMWAERHRLYR
jgi:asparagine synthase (glutamine-hydrolysing)